MSVLLLTMGPRLGLVMDTPALRVGEAGTIKLRAPGAVGQVKWTVVASDLPVEWGAITPNGEEATISTAEALEWGEYQITVRVVDSQRIPVARTFSVWVEPDAIVVTGPSTLDLVAGAPAASSYAITGGTGVYVSAQLVGAPASISAGISGASAVLSGSPTGLDVGTGAGKIVVTDSRGAQGAASFGWEVTNPPKIIVVGGFTTIGGQARQNRARFLDDGSLDGPIPGGFTLDTRGLATDALGRIVMSRSGVIRLLPDGTPDPSFTNPDATGRVDVVLPLPDGRYAIGGAFTVIGGVPRTRLAILHADGTLDTSFVPPSIDNAVGALALDSSGRLLIGGFFGTVGGAACPAIARLLMTGAHDTSFVSPFSSGTVNAIAIQSDGRIIVAGSSGADLRVTRLLANGSHDPAWTYVSVSRVCYALALDEADGVVYCGSGNSLFLRRHFLSNGSIDPSFTPTFNGAVYSVALQSDKKIVVGHGRDLFVGNTALRRLNTDGSVDWLSPAFSGDGVYRVALQVSP